MHADFRISLYRLLALASTISLVQSFYIPGMLCPVNYQFGDVIGADADKLSWLLQAGPFELTSTMKPSRSMSTKSIRITLISNMLIMTFHSFAHRPERNTPDMLVEEVFR